MAESDSINNDFWVGDQLDRKSVANYLETYLTSRYSTKKDEEGFVLAVNAEWGFGKSFMLERWQKELAFKKYPVVYFDAWKNDFTPEPLVAFISELDSGLESFFDKIPLGQRAFRSVMSSAKKLLKPTAKVIGFGVAKQLLGLGADRLIDLYDTDTDDIGGDDDDADSEKDSVKKSFDSTKDSLKKAVDEALKQHKTTKTAIREFREKLALLIDVLEKESNVQLPLFIFVDELDRCRPDYAIELLEGIKHLFGVKGIYFVVATNIAQLSHSVKAIYGNDFDGSRYLKRFFDLEYTLPMPSNFVFAKHLLSQITLPPKVRLVTGLEGNNETVADDEFLPYIFAKYFDYFDRGLRDQIQIVKIVDAAFMSLKKEQIHIHLLLFLLTLYQSSSQAFNALIKTNNVDNVFESYNDLILNTSKGIFTTTVYVRQGEEITSKSIPDIADIYFKARVSLTAEELNIKEVPSQMYPANLLRPLMAGPSVNGNAWTGTIDRYIDIVRYAGGFIDQK
jgi:hypothetical protein